MPTESQADDPAQPVAPPAPHPPRRFALNALLIALMALSLVAIFRKPLSRQLFLATNPRYINDDARILIYPFLRYYDPRLLQRDDAAAYLLDAMPIGYRSAYAAMSRLWDPRVFSKLIGISLVGLTVALAGAAAWRLGGAPAAWGTMALMLATDLYYWRMAGGLPRSFAYPSVALSALSLARGKAMWIGAATVLGALLYPVAGLISGITLCGVLFLLPRRWRGDAADWGWRKRIAVVAIVAAASALVIAPTALRLRQYGRTLRYDQTDVFPELGEDGRYGPADRPPFVLSLNGRAAAESALEGPGQGPEAVAAQPALAARRAMRLDIALALAAIAAAALVIREPGGRRLLALLAAGIIGHTLARWSLPNLYLPERYTTYVIPIFIAVTLPAGMVAIWRMIPVSRRVRWPGGALSLGTCIALLIMMRAGTSTDAGYPLHLRPKTPLMSFLRGLGPDTLIAAWPVGPMVQSIPYMIGRPMLITYETHQTFHEEYTLAMRDRFFALNDAYFARDVRPLRRLREQFGVTHLLLLRDFYRKQPWYFEPFVPWIRKRFKELDGQTPEPLRQIPYAGVYEDDEGWVVLDLRKLDERPTTRPIGHVDPSPIGVRPRRRR